MTHSVITRLLWTIPATLAGAIVCVIWAYFYFGESAPPLPGLARLMALIHGIAWVLFILPFAIIVSERSKLYHLPMSLIYGAALGALAFFVYSIMMTMLQGDSLKIWQLIGAYPLALGCALSGGTIAGVMSLLCNNHLQKHEC